MLSIGGLSKRYGGKELFTEASLRLVREDRIGLVGPNGAGKSTLFRMILGQEEPDNGTVALERGIRIGYLPQESAPIGEETVLEIALEVAPEMTAVRRRLRALHEGSAQPEADDHLLHAKFEAFGGHALEAKAKKILGGLGFREKDHDRPARELSGGWVMRAHLARLLAMQPDLLMLDEPTNHLDLESLLWFEDYLRNWNGAILTISHDREFLNRLVTGIVEIRARKLVRYKGNYETYIEAKALADEQQRAAAHAQVAEVERLKSLIARFGAKANKAAQANSWKGQIEKMEKIEMPSDDAIKIRFRFPQPVKGGRVAITLTDVHHAYGSQVVYEKMEFQAERGQRIVLVGPNGAGKSTLLKLLAEAIPLQSGKRELGYQTHAGYFAQYRLDTLRAGNTALEEAMQALRDAGYNMSEEFARTVLGAFLFRGDDVFKRVEVLSGGEKSRLVLVKLLLNPPNLILMDEPTTHLDMPSVDAMILALTQFEGTLIFISHDVHFIRKVGTKVVRVENGALEHYDGDYDYYLRRRAKAGGGPEEATVSSATEFKAVRTQDNRRDAKRAEAEARQERGRRRKVLATEVERMEMEIHEVEHRRHELTAQLELPETYETPGHAAEVSRELKAIETKLPSMHENWERSAAQLEAMD